ncbi:MAG: alpha/beta fold hydrolase [Acetobacteraceae bacterium]|nr:alpha/beta fold hydrolase [Acetobacteraceae bacterium]
MNRIDLPTGRLEARWLGAPSEAVPTLVLLHEGLGSVGLWRDFPARLAAATGCGVLAYSRFGYGHSDSVALPRPLDYMRREAVEVLPGVLDAARVARAVLVGHSDGASIAAIYAGRVADPRVLGLVLMAPHFFVEEICLDSIAAIRREYDTGLRARLARHHGDVDAAFLGWADAWLDPGFPAAFDLSPELARISVPTLILQGEHDPYGTVAHARLAERLAPADVRTVLLAAGHAPHVEASAETVAEIARFVARLPSPRPPPARGGGE